ncbi:PREDICTED: cAMP-specific 3',5'-cAMP phosphodiesterase 4 isoform X2 [Bactrocera latifrons]|nr:PREDICTED: cAMP-specific 3',5'-cAMP phosphodiesterase 4 isoform X1 [Bactrocera latifrons]XP_018783500.1 PREDICTED: cAMP-specific 3',5'-cAMP phosphodiesterase 4 isoform X2 [Bactrocera latifrons]
MAIIEHFLKLQKRVTNFGVMLGGSTDRLCTPSTSAGPFRIFAVTGFQNRANDIVYCPPIRPTGSENAEDSTAVVYFGGDVQDFPESMETNRDSRGYMKYNLENSAILLREAFPRAHIIVIRPVRMEFKTFSCFDNFVRGNNAGVPDHTPMNHALQHLEKLLQNLSQRLISIPENEIMDQAAQAAAAAAAVAAAAALVSSTLSTASTDTSASSSALNDNNQDMDIDILQVQENVTVDADGAVIFPNATGAGTGGGASSGGGVTASTNNAANSNIATTTATPHSTQKAPLQSTAHQAQTNNAHFNNIGGGSSNSNECVAQAQQLTRQNSNPLWWRENLNLDKAKLVLIGFSKGCVVLNQFIYEFHYLKTLTPDDSTMIRLLSRIKDMYWLDGGHGGQKNTWITSRSLLETLTRMGMNIHVHLTPYQVQDDRRPWIRKEEKIFTDMLRRLGAPITRHLHYDSQTANLMTHFEVLQAFCQHIHTLNQQQQLQQQQTAQQQQQQASALQPLQQSSSNIQINEQLQQQQQTQLNNTNRSELGKASNSGAK